MTHDLVIGGFGNSASSNGKVILFFQILTTIDNGTTVLIKVCSWNHLSMIHQWSVNIICLTVDFCLPKPNSTIPYINRAMIFDLVLWWVNWSRVAYDTRSLVKQSAMLFFFYRRRRWRRWRSGGVHCWVATQATVEWHLSTGITID